ncbi:MAG: M4 family metallopeptidase, partial [Verrucomicrobiales bacterium]|nr:M4 family metallopeptidase [Verrucomicrobiales bacterium]
MKTTLLSALVAAMSTGILLALPPAPPPASTSATATSDPSALEALRLRLAAERGVSGRPTPSVASPPRLDSRTLRLGQAISNSAVLRRLAASQPQPAGALPAAAADTPRERQRAAVRRLTTTVGPELQVHLRSENGTLRQARGGVLARAAAGPAKASPDERRLATALAFLDAHADLLQLDRPSEELVLERSEPDGLGGRHLRFSQRLGDLPVWPATLSVHLDPQGNLALVEGAYVPTPRNLPQHPAVAAADAVLRGRASVPGGMRGEAGTPELIVHAPLDGEPRLAWRFTLNVGFTQAWSFVVDASDGRILRRSNRILDAGITGRGVDLQGVSRTLSVWQAEGTHFLIDTSKAMFKAGSDPVKKPEGAITIADARNKSINELKGSDVFLVTSPNPNQWDIPDAVSAAYNYSRTYDYFLAQHERNSLDGKGGNITAVVRVGEYDNASWNGNLRLMLFGTVQPYAGALDVVGHELTHGLTEDSANLVYENQPGALNESFSDIFGEMVEAYVDGQPDWKMGTRLTRVFRDFKNPGSLTIGGMNRPYPSKMSEFVQLPNTNDGDHGGVHINSSIINHAFWLLAEGLSGAVGMRDAERIFFRTLTQHLQAQSQFIDTRLGAIAAAEALFGAGSNQAKKTAEAFDAIEVFSAPETPAPAPVPVVSGPDSTLFIAADPFFGDLTLYRQESAQGDGGGGSDFAYGIRLSRPAVTGDGQLALFVDEDNDLCLAETANPNSRECLNVPGLVHSVAVSPDSRFGAFVFRDANTGEPDNRIRLINLADGSSQTFELLAPVLDGVPVDGILYADSMTFATDSKVLYYDALSRLRFGSGPTVERWSIYALHVETGKISIVVPPFEGIDTGNPSAARAGTRYLAFDARVASTMNSSIVTLDLFSGTVAEVGVVQSGLGSPAWVGDESAIVHAQQDPSAFGSGFSLVRQGLGADRLSVAGQPSLWMHDAGLGVIYRRGTFTGANASPQATITRPTPGTQFPVGTAVTIEANATDADGTVARVEFYDGDDKIGEDASAPFAFTWTPAGAGSHRLVARAIDNLGAAGDASAVTVTVGSGQPADPARLSVAALPGGSMRITVRAPAGNYVISLSTDLRQWSDIYPVTVGASGSGTVDDA